MTRIKQLDHVDITVADLGLVGGLGHYENTWGMAHVRGPDGIVVGLTARID